MLQTNRMVFLVQVLGYKPAPRQHYQARHSHPSLILIGETVIMKSRDLFDVASLGGGANEVVQ